MREKLSKKILVLGIDGLDPRFTKKMLREGNMPNTQKLISRGAAREDLVLLGGHSTGTPPMWTTLATGCYANVHGITGFFRQSKKSGFHPLQSGTSLELLCGSWLENPRLALARFLLASDQ